MAAETAEIRSKARRVKSHILDQYLKLADRVEAKGAGDLSENEASKYWQLTQDFAKNVIPRSQELTGEDGEPIRITGETQAKANQAIEKFLHGNTGDTTNEQPVPDPAALPVPDNG